LRIEILVRKCYNTIRTLQTKPLDSLLRDRLEVFTHGAEWGTGVPHGLQNRS
jgi:hypothetical protein